MAISPGVYTKIIDLSYYLQEVPITTGFIPFFTRRGPDNKLMHSTGQDYFQKLYGEPNINDYGKKYGLGPYIAFNHLKYSGSCYTLRLLPDDATYANLFLDLNTDGTGSVEVRSIPASTGITSLENDAEKAQYMNQIGSNIYPFIMFYPIGRGDSYNDFGITIKPHSNPVLASEGVYTLNVYETSKELPKDNLKESFDVSFDPLALDEEGESRFIEEVINRYSDILRCYVDEEHLNLFLQSDVSVNVENPLGVIEYPPGSGIQIESPAIHFSGGSEGSLVTVDPVTGRRLIDSNVAISLLVQAYQGMNQYDDVIDLDNVYFSLVYDAGYPPEVKEAIRALAEDLRRDCVAIVDLGDNPNLDKDIQARNSYPILDTFFAAYFTPFSKIYDVHSGKNIWVSPVYHMSDMIPKNDKIYSLHKPNAGYNRGMIAGIKELRYNAKTIGQRDQLYLNQINPIVKFNIGYTVWGNLTSQKRPSKLSNLSTVRTVLYIKRALEQFCKWYIFEWNNDDTYNAVATEIVGFLQTLQDAKALDGYSVEVGATEYEKKQKIMHVNVVLIPVGIIERINLNLFIK